VPLCAKEIVRTLPAASIVFTTASLQCGVRFSMNHVNLIGYFGKLVDGPRSPRTR
jgi:hypothetical protein